MTRQNLMGIGVLLACCLAAPGFAEDIYKRVDADGNLEFSDRPSPDADRIEVQPNVIETNPVTRRSARQKEPVANRDVTETVTGSKSDDDADATVTEVDGDPNPGRATRNAVRAISQPQPRPR